MHLQNFFLYFSVSLFFPQRCGCHADCKINDPCIEVSNRCKRESQFSFFGMAQCFINVHCNRITNLLMNHFSSFKLQ